MKKVLPTVENWYSRWRLQINVEKTRALFVANKNIEPPENKIILYNEEREWFTAEKYLGIVLDKTLNFKEHIDKIKSSCGVPNPIMGWKSKVSIKNKMIIYTHIILSTLLYAWSVWARTAKTRMKALNKIHNSYVKKATKVPWFIRGDVVLRGLGIPTITEIIQDRTLKFYENFEHHPNQLLPEAMKYPLWKIRKRERLSTGKSTLTTQVIQDTAKHKKHNYSTTIPSWQKPSSEFLSSVSKFPPEMNDQLQQTHNSSIMWTAAPHRLNPH